MTNEQIIKVAESLGLEYTGMSDEGRPEFIGSKSQWDAFDKVDTSEVIEDADFTGSDNEDR